MGPPALSEREGFPPEFSPGERALLTAMEAIQHENREVLRAEHAENTARLDNMDREMKAMAATWKAAFPDGNADDHRRYHEALIRKAEARARLYEKLLAELVSKGLWALLILFVTGIGLAVKEKFLK